MKPLQLKKLVPGVAVPLLLATSAWAAPVAYGGHYYDVIQAPTISWADARAAALTNTYLGLQGHLVTITSAGEDAAVKAMIQTNGGGEMWAGGYQDPTNPLSATSSTAGWTWVNGEGSFPGVDSATPYADWNGGEPNDAYGAGSEQFLGLNLSGGGWNDEGNLSLITGYVIEYDPNTINDVPEPAGLALVGMGLLGLAVTRRRRVSR